MIDLAPRHKQGLQLQNPIMIGGGTAGYGEALHPAVDSARLGAIVVGPMLRYSSGGSSSPRIAEAASSFVLKTGWQNRGVSSALKRYATLWSRLGCPIIVQVADSQAELLEEVVERLNDAFYDGASISGVELVLPMDVDEDQADLLVTTALRSTELPLLVHLPLHTAEHLAEPVVYAGADALVVGRGPKGMLFRPAAMEKRFDNPSARNEAPLPISGISGGPGLFPLMVEKLHQIQSQELDVPVVASGLVHSVAQAKQALSSGAAALQIGSALWVEPGLASQLLDELGQ